MVDRHPVRSTLLLVLLFHKFLQPVTILAALPPSAGGALFLPVHHRLRAVAMPSLIGMLMLMGIVTKNSILLVEYAIMAQHEHGMSRFDALIDACSKRARPIVMTTIAMGAGMLPIAMGWSGDPSFRAPMGVAVIGGLLASTALSLFVVPVIFTIIDDFQQKLRRQLRRGSRSRTLAAQPAQSATRLVVLLLAADRLAEKHQAVVQRRDHVDVRRRALIAARDGIGGVAALP